MDKKEIQLGVRLDPSLAQRARRQAETEHRTLSQVVRMLLENWLKKSAKRAA
jgi:hypothetical protein